MPNNWQTTLWGLLAGAMTIGRGFVKPQYQSAFDAAIGLFTGMLGWRATDKKSLW